MIKWKAQWSNRASASWARAARLLCCVAVLGACGDGHSSSREDSGEPSTEADASSTEGDDSGADQENDGAPLEDDAGLIPDAATTDADARPEAGMPCETDDDCNDGLYCNGTESCAPASDGGEKVCKLGSPPECTREHPCMEELGACDCRNPDLDYDNDGAEVCLDNKVETRHVPRYKDCDDTTNTRCSHNTEECDNRDLDEDCDSETYGKRDQDGDGYNDATCRNWDKQGKPHGGDDCNDHSPQFHPWAQEICDYFDNDCNGYVDETHFSANPDDFERKDGGQRELLLPDQDRDGHGKTGVPPILLCRVTEEEGLVVATASKDCDDTNPHTYEGALEICDGLDNDCDGKIDTGDEADANSGGLEEKYFFPGTKVSCVGGVWKILAGDCPNDDVEWCEDRDPIEQGCRTDATRLSSCRACATDCQFACGQRGCDEVVEIAVGPEHVCSRTKEGSVACWGRGESGRLGNDSTAPSSVPAPVIGLSSVTGIAVGQAHSCAIAAPNNTLYCWGSNLHGQLGNADAGDASAVPVPVVGVATPTLINVAQVAAGDLHTCAILESGSLVCFGEGEEGRLGNGSLAPGSALPRPARRRVILAGRPFDQNVVNAKTMALGSTHGCIETTTGSVECWGSNAAGQLGQPASVASSPYLLSVAGLPIVSEVGAGANHNCALAPDGVWCWGEDVWLQLGRADTPDVTENWTPKRIEGSHDATKLGVGAFSSCRVTSDGTTYCWGRNGGGVLGPNFIGVQTQLPVLLPVTTQSVRPGAVSACALETAGYVSCWGSNRYGQLGAGAQQDNPTPKQVRPLRVTP